MWLTFDGGGAAGSMEQTPPSTVEIAGKQIVRFPVNLERAAFKMPRSAGVHALSGLRG